MQFIFMWSYQARFQNFIQNCTFVVISFVRLTLCKFFCYLINQFLNSSFCFFFYRGKFIAWLVYRDRSTNLHLLLKFSAEDLSFELEQHPTSYCYIHLNAVCVWFRRKRWIVRQSPCEVTHEHNRMLSDTPEKYFSRIYSLHDEFSVAKRNLKAVSFWESQSTDRSLREMKYDKKQPNPKSHNIPYVGFVFSFIPEYVPAFSEKVIEKHRKYKRGVLRRTKFQVRKRANRKREMFRRTKFYVRRWANWKWGWSVRSSSPVYITYKNENIRLIILFFKSYVVRYFLQ